jgi:hypothetical protein
MWGDVEATRCFNLKGLWVSVAVFDVATDVVILVMPIPLIWKLNLRSGQKIMVTGVFLLGAVVVVFSLMSCSAIVSSLQSDDEENQCTKSSLRPTPILLFDKTNHQSDTFGLANLFSGTVSTHKLRSTLMLNAVLESGMGIIGACLPIMRQPMAHIFPSLIKSYGARRPQRYYEDRNSEPFVLQDFSGRQKDGVSTTWHSVSASGPERFKTSVPRQSDELGIIEETDARQHDRAGRNMSGIFDDRELGRAIRKDVKYEIQRK